MVASEREVLKTSLKILNKTFQGWVKVERRTSGLFKNMGGHWVRVGKTSEADIGGWILKGPYIAKSLAIEVKRSSFRPTHLSKADKARFINQCQYLRKINSEGGVGFWINDSSMLFPVLMKTLIHGARVSLDINNLVVITLK